MGAALAIKQGAKSSNKLAKKVAGEMTKEQLKDFAVKETFTLKDALKLMEERPEDDGETSESDADEINDGICPACDGTGEGQYEDTKCRSCGGSGVEKDSDNGDAEDAADHRYQQQRDDGLGEGLGSNLANRFKAAYHNTRMHSALDTAGRAHAKGDVATADSAVAAAREHGDRALHNTFQRGGTLDRSGMSASAQEARKAGLEKKYGSENEELTPKQKRAHEYNMDSAQRDMDAREQQGEDMSNATIDPNTYEIVKGKKTNESITFKEFLLTEASKKPLKKASKSVYRRDYLKTKNKPYRKYDAAEHEAGK